MTRYVLLPLVLLVSLAGPAHAQHARSQRDRISPEEVRASTATDAYQLVQSLRSMWFTRRDARLASPTAPSPRRDPEGTLPEMTPGAVAAATPQPEEGASGVIVLLDGALLGGRETLREIPLNRVDSVEFLTPEQARMRYDRRTRDGAIVVHSVGAGDR